MSGCRPPQPLKHPDLIPVLETEIKQWQEACAEYREQAIFAALADGVKLNEMQIVETTTWEKSHLKFKYSCEVTSKP